MKIDGSDDNQSLSRFTVSQVNILDATDEQTLELRINTANKIFVFFSYENCKDIEND